MVALTPSQLAVLRQTIVQDATYKEAGLRLGISPATVRKHVNDAYLRLGCSGGSKRDAAIALGWGWPPEEKAA